MTPADEVTAHAYADTVAALAVAAALRDARAAVLAMAARQEAFAAPDYTQCADVDRVMFRHAAKMLRAAADLLKPSVKA